MDEMIQKQQRQFSIYLARIISVLILGIPYLALSLIAVFLQNNFFNWTIKGIVIGVLTIVLLLLAGFAFKRIEAIIAKHIEEKMK